MTHHPFTFTLPPQLDEHSWVRVEGAPLPQPLDVKFRLDGLTLRITALRFDNDSEITSSSLRSVRLGEIAEELRQFLYDELDDLTAQEHSAADSLAALQVTREQATKLARGRDAYFARGLRSEPTPEADNYWAMVEAAHMRDQLSYWLNRLQVDQEAAERLRHRGPGAKPPTHQDLEAFARTYLEEQRDKARGAKARTARRLHMDRGTVYRWIRDCQEHGLLPTEGAREHG